MQCRESSTWICQFCQITLFCICRYSTLKIWITHKGWKNRYVGEDYEENIIYDVRCHGIVRGIMHGFSISV